MTHYPIQFYEEYKDKSLFSAREIIPIILRYISISSVVDVGCGLGTWLKGFKENGIDDILGIDGEYVDTKSLLIPESRFVPCDLRKPVELKRKFDLAISLEVAEHLPVSHAENFIEYLTGLAPVVLFSAAVPGQGGTNHINEQWPAYWANLFESHNFVCLDFLRQQIWNNKNIEYWYSQNIVLYVHKSELDKYSQLEKEYTVSHSKPLALIHPQKFHEIVELLNGYRNLNPDYTSLKKVLKALPMLLKSSIKKRMKNIF